MGLKTCAIERGRPLSELGVRVQGYGSGAVRVTSDSCEVDYPARYTGSAEVAVPLEGAARDHCMLAVVVTPEFPGERDSSLVIGALKAFVWVHVVDQGEAWQGFEDRLPTGSTTSIALEARPGDHIMVRGCGAKLDRTASEQGVERVKLSELPDPGVKLCAYEGAVLAQGAPPRFFSWLVARHRKDYVEPETPAFELEGDKLTLGGAGYVSVLALDANFQVSGGRQFKMDPAKPHVVRALSISGRNVLGLYEPGRGFKWTR
jgi:hypothetical protein